MEYRNGEYETRINIYCLSPQEVSNMQRLIDRDKSALNDIKRCEAAIEQLKQYRLELAQRAQELATMQYHIRTTLLRNKSWRTGKVEYFITTEKVFEDESCELISNVKFEGRERYKAIDIFENLKKENPHYEFIKDIAKKQWEK